MRSRFMPGATFLATVLSSLVFTLSSAQTISVQAFSVMRWRPVGPFRAGRSIAAAGIPGNPYTFYFGSVDGGMWKTINAGDLMQLNRNIEMLGISKLSVATPSLQHLTE